MEPIEALQRVIIGVIGAGLVFFMAWVIFSKYARIPEQQLYTKEIRGTPEQIAELIAKQVYRCWYQSNCGRHKETLSCMSRKVIVEKKGTVDEADVTAALEALGVCGLCDCPSSRCHMGLSTWAIPGVTYYWMCFVVYDGESMSCDEIPNCRFEEGDGTTCPKSCFGHPNLNNRIVWKGRKIYAETDVNIKHEFNIDWRHLKGWGRIVIETE